ncbi:MAG: hypothetical protein ACREEM_44005 [Blastocatellia bacterium]
MAEEVLVKESLTKEMIAAGENLAKRIRQSKLKTSAMLWLYNSLLDEWNFVIVSPEMKTLGPDNLYDKIQEILSQLPADQPQISFNDIFVFSPDDYRVTPFREVKARGKTISGRRLRRTVMDGVFIDDSYIYSLT